MKFKNTYKSTRSGFSHTSQLFSESGKLLATGVCHYINRTWEEYDFQSSMREAVSVAVEIEIQRQKRLQGIKRLTAKKSEEIVAYSSLINQLKNLKV
jgi:hypothetical protein